MLLWLSTSLHLPVDAGDMMYLSINGAMPSSDVPAVQLSLTGKSSL